MVGGNSKCVLGALTHNQSACRCSVQQASLKAAHRTSPSGMLKALLANWLPQQYCKATSKLSASSVQHKVSHLPCSCLLQGLSTWLASTALSHNWRPIAGRAAADFNSCQQAGARQCKAITAHHELQLDPHHQWRQLAHSWSSHLTAHLYTSWPAGFTGSRYVSSNTTAMASDQAAEPLRKLTRSAVHAAVARIAQQAEQEYNGRPLTGVTRPTGGAPGIFSCNLLVGPRSDLHHCWIQPLTYVQAAVAYDLGRCALLAPEFTVNFNPRLYSSSDIKSMQQYLQQVKPGIFAAAVTAASTYPPPDYHTLKAQELADAAVEAAVAAVAASVDSHSQQGCCRISSAAVRAHIHENLQPCDSRKPKAGSTKSWIRHYRTYDSMLKAAIAADIMRQALGRPAVNFSPDVTAAGVPAMKVWLELNRHRLTVQKEAWKAKAAAMSSAGAVEDGQDTG